VPCGGLDGIKRELVPPANIDGNIFEMSKKEQKELGIESLPGTLYQAIEELEKDPFIKEVLGKHTYQKYLEAKKRNGKNTPARLPAGKLINTFINSKGKRIYEGGDISGKHNCCVSEHR
jgi:glutamine synthetase